MGNPTYHFPFYEVNFPLVATEFQIETNLVYYKDSLLNKRKLANKNCVGTKVASVNPTV